MRVIILILATIQIASAGNFTFEAAAGAGANVTPFSSRWNGTVGPEGLYFKEYAVRISYKVNDMFTARSVFGRYTYFFEDNTWYAMPHGPEPDYWPSRSRNIKSVYFIPSMRVNLSMMNIDAGLLFHDDHDDNTWFYEASGELKDKFTIVPSFGIELGDGGTFIYTRNFDSFPMFTGGGIWEIGIGHRYSGQYEHKLYLATFGEKMAGIGYRGEFKISVDSGLSFGWMMGSTDNDTVHIFNLGYIYNGGL